MSDKNPSFLHVIVNPEQAGSRLDKFLSSLTDIPSRSRAGELIASDLVLLNGRPMKASYKVRAGDHFEIQMPAPEPTTIVPMAAPLEILYEDSDVLVVNKPAGLVVHPAAGHAQDTLVNILLHHAKDLSMGFAENRPGIVHRLDRDTSGILVVAKNDLAHHDLAAQFKNKTVHRIYWALVAPPPKPRQGAIRSYLGRHPTDRKRFASRPTGKWAVTHYRVLKTSNSDVAWLECRLETGRTHQIRVHVSESGFPILGDPLYGTKRRKKVEHRLALHAVELGFRHPRSGKEMFFHLDWPADLEAVVKKLGFEDV